MTERQVSVIGLGYVGLPVAVAFARRGRVIGFDISDARLDALRSGVDITGEVDDTDLAEVEIEFTRDPDALAEADFHIIAVPTPVDGSNRPDLSALESAAKTVGAILKSGDIVVVESTVYPGATEQICRPILEAASGLREGKDFHLGYSPERINPGDRAHRFETIRKVVAASDSDVLELIAQVYGAVIPAGVFKAASIRTAEAAKLIENVQRDVNVALMNEFSLMFDRLDLDTGDVLAAAGTKWNFLDFKPGLVGGHCVGVDPYYLTHVAEAAGYHSRLVPTGRQLNDEMPRHVARHVVKALLKRGGTKPTVTVLGMAFKENVPDIRNSRVIDIITELTESGVAVQVHDPLADPEAVETAYGIALTYRDELLPAQAVVIATAHDLYRETGWGFVEDLLDAGSGFVADVSGVLDRAACPAGVELWRL